MKLCLTPNQLQKSYYEILEVPTHSTLTQIRNAYLKKSIQFHPDKVIYNNNFFIPYFLIKPRENARIELKEFAENQNVSSTGKTTTVREKKKRETKIKDDHATSQRHNARNQKQQQKERASDKRPKRIPNHTRTPTTIRQIHSPLMDPLHHRRPSPRRLQRPMAFKKLRHPLLHQRSHQKIVFPPFIRFERS